MDPSIVTAVLVLIGTLLGALIAVIGNIVSTRAASRNEFRRIAVEAGLREWEQLVAHARQHGGETYPPSLFVYYHAELLRLIDEDRLTPETYRDVTARREQIRKVIAEDSKRRARERREEDQTNGR